MSLGSLLADVPEVPVEVPFLVAGSAGSLAVGVSSAVEKEVCMSLLFSVSAAAAAGLSLLLGSLESAAAVPGI